MYNKLTKMPSPEKQQQSIFQVIDWFRDLRGVPQDKPSVDLTAEPEIDASEAVKQAQEHLHRRSLIQELQKKFRRLQ